MRALAVLLVLLCAASVEAQPAAWRAETTVPLAGRSPGDVGVRVERTVWRGLGLGVGRTEWRAATAFATVRAPAGAFAPRALLGATVLDGDVVPVLGGGVDLGLTSSLGVSVGAERAFGAGRAADIVRAGLLVAPDRLVPAGASERLFPSDGPEAAPHWRVALSGGLTGPFAGLASLAAEHTWRGPFAYGGRLWITTSSSNFQDDGGFLNAGGAEALVSAGTRGKWADLRASTGAGLAVIDYDAGGLILCYDDLAPETCSGGGDSFDGVRPYAVARVGLDLYPHAAVGVGAAIHAALMEGPANVSAVELGLRLRLGDGP